MPSGTTEFLQLSTERPTGQRAFALPASLAALLSLQPCESRRVKPLRENQRLTHLLHDSAPTDVLQRVHRLPVLKTIIVVDLLNSCSALIGQKCYANLSV